MQVKIIIGTISFMLTMILLGFYSLLEPNRLANYTDARYGRQVEAGAEIFKNNCASCHGVNGKGTNGGECYGPDGAEIACVGRPLNSYGLLCGDVTQRMEQASWAGSKADFVKHTIAAGRNGQMPTWSQDFGGPMQRDQVDNVTLFVLNYYDGEDGELCSIPPFAFPWPENFQDLANVTEEEVAAALPEGVAFDYEKFPVNLEGDADRGKELYAGVYACNSCHGLPEGVDEQGSGPWHGDYAETVADRVGESNVDGSRTYESVEDYTYYSILYPNDYIVDGYAEGVMTVFSTDQQMNTNPQDLADLIAYMLADK